jgi:ubiquinone/menaquinone biosynthesis C-methylase UbiE
MPSQVDLYDHAYANVEDDVYRAIRTETYGQDLGQTSWVTTEESERIPELLGLRRESTVLEIGCGSGMYAIHLAKRVGSRVTAVDVNPHAIAGAAQLAAASGLDRLVQFAQGDLSRALGFADGSFDAAYANDVLCHIPERPRLLRELARVLRPGGRLLFSDALVIGGVVSQVELATRSSIGLYFFSPPGENERLLVSSGFTVLSANETSEQAAEIAERWRDARERRREQLIQMEGPERYEGLQRFLGCVHALTTERRLLRFVYLAQKCGAEA